MSSFLFSSTFTLNEQQKEDINNTLVTLLTQQDGQLAQSHQTVQTLLDTTQAVYGGYNTTKYDYIYKVLIDETSRIGVFMKSDSIG